MQQQTPLSSLRSFMPQQQPLNIQGIHELLQRPYGLAIHGSPIFIYENAHIALDQKAYQKRYDNLTTRYETLKTHIENLNDQIQQTQAQKAGVEDFLKAFEKMPEQLTDFSLDAFNALTDCLTVNSDGDIDVTFRNGQTIKA